MLPRIQRLGRMNRFFAMVCRRICDKAEKPPEFMKTWEVNSRRCTLNEQSAELIRSCIEKNRRYQKSIVMEKCGYREIFLHTEKKLDLAFLTQDITKQHLYRKMNHFISSIRKERFSLPLTEYYEKATGTEDLDEGDPLLIVGIANKMSMRYLPVYTYRSIGMLSCERLELFILMTADDLISVMKPCNMVLYQVMLHSVYKIECLLKLPRTSITPPMKPFQKAPKWEKLKILDEYVSKNYVYLVHFVRNDNFYLEPEFREFQAFVAIFRHRDTYLIKKLESTFPGSGVPLIMAGYTMIQKRKHLTTEQFLDIFKIVKTVETYKDLSLMEEEHLDDEYAQDAENVGMLYDQILQSQYLVMTRYGTFRG